MSCYISGPVDRIFHLASLASPVDYLNHPLETLESGSTGNRNMLELARTSGARFLLTSTSECYGDPLEHPQSETYWGNVNPVGLRSCYDESKRYAKAITMAYHRVHGLQTNIARIFNTYGPRMACNEIRRRFGNTIGIEYLPLPSDDPKLRRPDITKARNLLGWEPKVTLGEGLSATIDYFKNKGDSRCFLSRCKLLASFDRLFHYCIY